MTTSRPMTSVHIVEDCPWGRAGDVREVPADWVPAITDDPLTDPVTVVVAAPGEVVNVPEALPPVAAV